jgi:tRNA A-37 threonylcarbamoyl transferase component Bud32
LSADPVIGTVVAGHRIETVIGHGGMGAVYRGRHVHLGKSRAIKLLPPHLADDVAFRTRFEREWRAAAEIEHPSIVEVLDAGEQDGRLYIVMRYVDGVDLHRVIETDGPLGPERAVAVLAPVADALDAAHARGLVHRDVKPSNILVAGDDRAYLSDFGIAKSSSTRGVTKTGFFVGTVDYAAPEQIESRPLDGRTDVYALGGVLYSCVTGAPPYERDTDLQVMYAQLHDPVPAPSAVRADVPSGLDEVVASAMAKSADDRYATCGELLRAAQAAVRRSAPTAAAATKLEAALPTELAPVARTEIAPQTEPEPTGPARRSLLLFLLAAAVLLGATAAGAAILLGGSDEIDVTGRVLDSRTGEPLAGVSVETDEVAAVTRADGRFTVLDVAPDEVIRFASCAHMGRQAAAETVEAEVRLSSRPVTGKVTSRLTGRPVVATVREGARRARTRANGSYSLHGSCPGSTVTVTAPGFVSEKAIVANRRADVALAVPKTIRETFSNVRNWFAGAGAATGSSADGWTAFVADGAYHVRVTRPNYESGANAADFDPATKSISDNVSYVKPTDIRYTVESRKVTGADDSTAAGVTCNAKSGLSYEFLVGSDGFYRLDRRPRQGARTVELWAWEQSPAIARGGGTNRLQVVCRGNPVRLRLSVNGTRLIDVTDGRRAPGFQSIYLYAASYATAPIEIAFDNLVFTRE